MTFFYVTPTPLFYFIVITLTCFIIISRLQGQLYFMISPYCLFVYVSVYVHLSEYALPPISFRSLMGSSYCPCVCVSPLSLLGNGPSVTVCPPVILSSAMMSVWGISCSQGYLLSFVFIKMVYSPKNLR